MPTPNKTGGPQHDERVTKVDQLNSQGQSKSLYANQPNEFGWQHEGELFKDAPARQCQAQQSPWKYCSVCDTRYNECKKPTCPECGSSDYYKLRCPNMAEPAHTTCSGHGGTTKLTNEQKDKRLLTGIKTGHHLAAIMLCPCMQKDTCPYVGQLVDVERYGSTVPRCLPEQDVYDTTIEHFRNTYELDPAADQIMLNRMVMSMIRIIRGENIIAQYGEIVERTKQSPDGSYESWYEQSAVAKTVDSLDRRVQAWLKELNVTKAAREGQKITVNKTVDLTTTLSRKSITEDIIDVEFNEC